MLALAETPLQRLATLVRQRCAWAVAKLRLVEAAARPRRTREFVSGEGFTYLGRSFRLAEKEVDAKRVDNGHHRLEAYARWNTGAVVVVGRVDDS